MPDHSQVKPSRRRVVKSVEARERTGDRSGGQLMVTVVTVVAALSFLVLGAWAFLAPRSFYDNIATFEPYNLHLLHDLGAFQLAIGASLLAALLWRDGLSVALAGATVGAVVHDVSHFMDRDLGGRSSDPWALGLLAVLLLAALALRIRARGRAGRMR
jgi:hypothetical protein